MPTSAATLALIEAVGLRPGLFLQIQHRPGRRRRTLPDQVPAAVKAARLEQLQALLRDQQARSNRGHGGRTVPVLLERAGRQ